MKRIILLLFIIQFVHAGDLETDYERSGFKKTPRYDATVEYCRLLDSAFTTITYTSFGTTPQGRELPLLIADAREEFVPGQGRERAVLMIQACIHAGESDGKDAGFMLLRDLARNGLPENVTILFIPIFNVDGHERFGPYNRINQDGPEEMGYRVTAQNLNLNRDYLKADTPEMQAWLRLYNQWLPDFFVDTHVTDGADFQYAISYKIATYENLAEPVRNWVNDYFVPKLESDMVNRGFPTINYIFFRNSHDVRSGLESWAESPRFSQGYTILHNRPGLLIETHMLKDYRTRVTATYHMLASVVKMISEQQRPLAAAIRSADKFTASPAFQAEPFPLRFTDTSDSVMVDFLGVEYDVVKSDISGGDWYRFYPDKKKTYRIPYYNDQKTTLAVNLPAAYVIPAEWSEVIRRLEIHGVQMQRLAQPATLKVDSYKFSNPRWRNAPYEGHFTVSFDMDSIRETRSFPEGSVLIPLNQPAARVAVHALEPRAPDSFVQWGFFNAVFERREYAESYVLEVLARKMLAEDAELKEEFEHKVATDSSFAANPWARLDFFYRRTPYFDNRWNIYPVGKLAELPRITN